jgi:hypothetical protein
MAISGSKSKIMGVKFLARHPRARSHSYFAALRLAAQHALIRRDTSTFCAADIRFAFRRPFAPFEGALALARSSQAKAGKRRLRRG